MLSAPEDGAKKPGLGYPALNSQLMRADILPGDISPFYDYVDPTAAVGSHWGCFWLEMLLWSLMQQMVPTGGLFCFGDDFIFISMYML